MEKIASSKCADAFIKKSEVVTECFDGADKVVCLDLQSPNTI